MAQLGARFHGMEEVVGSIPTRSTKSFQQLTRLETHPTSPPTQDGIFTAFPEAFRRQSRYLAVAMLVTVLGCALGGLAVHYDPAAVDVLLPADYLRNPAKRVLDEQQGERQQFNSAQAEAAFSGQLIKHNVQVALLAAALGVTFGIGTALLLFENGVMLGAVAVHYTQQGFGLFMTAWLLPHGVFEIPSILIAGQAGFYLARLLLHRSEDRDVRQSMREWLVLVAGLAMMLVWAGMMEAFFSQHHAPVLPYGFKVAVAVAELVLLTMYLLLIGRKEIGTQTRQIVPSEKG